MPLVRRALTLACLVAVAGVGVTGPLAAASATSARAPAQATAYDDPGLDLEWGLTAIGATDAWKTGTGKGATIAVVDSGADLGHEDLRTQIVGAVSCLDTGGDPGACTPGGRDDDGHGTHVAGIAAAIGGNGVGIAGVAPRAGLLIVKVLERTCGLGGCEASGKGSDVAAGVRYAADHGADVINLSLGNTVQAVLGPSFADAIRYAWSKGAIPVVAAGNRYLLPSGFSNEPAVVVGALNRTGTKASYSSGVGAARWSVSAPGGEADTDESCVAGGAPEGILSTYWDGESPNGYACLAGTSMAAPHVSGALAVLLGAGLNPQAAVDKLLASADDLGEGGVDSTYGSGRVNLARAVRGIGTDTTTTATATTQPPVTTAPEQSTTSAQPTTSATAAPDTTTATAPATSDPSFDPENASGLTPGDDDQPPPAAWVTIAVLLVIAIGGTSGWWLVKGAGWARRTPQN